MKRINVAKARMEMMQCLEDAGEVPVLKRIQVRIHHSTHPPFKLRLRPHTRVSDVLVYLNLPSEDYLLSLANDPTKTFSPEENLYVVIENDQKLIAKLSPEAEAKFAATFLP
jgi:hypothetical protein